MYSSEKSCSSNILSLLKSTRGPFPLNGLSIYENLHPFKQFCLSFSSHLGDR